MDPISSSVQAINAAFTRYDRASKNLLDGVSGVSDADPAVAMAEQVVAKRQVQASVATVRIADEMFRELLQISREG